MQANSTDWQYGLWSTFLMEMLIRASISHVSPALVADGSDWNNILYALGHAPKKAKFVPRTALITELIGKNWSLRLRASMSTFAWHISQRETRSFILET